jgi:hypothetical protein
MPDRSVCLETESFPAIFPPYKETHEKGFSNPASDKSALEGYSSSLKEYLFDFAFDITFQ